MVEEIQNPRYRQTKIPRKKKTFYKKVLYSQKKSETGQAATSTMEMDIHIYALVVLVQGFFSQLMNFNYMIGNHPWREGLYQPRPIQQSYEFKALILVL